ncbi:hypothetical protein Pfo_028685 [Paulownia fortunei]|nr:hypothetical protein Pfo_028685 [Paulownia fortunei]
MADSSLSSSSKLVYFVVIPLILLSGLLIILNQKPSSSYSWPSFHDPANSHSGARGPPATGKDVEQTSRAAPPPATPATGDQLPVMEKEESKKSARYWKKYSNLDNFEIIEASLAQARATIQESLRNNETSYDPDYVPAGPFYRNANAFHRSYLEMEKMFKIYVYEEGDPPLFHYSKSLGILVNSQLCLCDPQPSMESTAKYSERLCETYFHEVPYWNRTLGHDHFILGCHDWTPTISHGVPYLFKNSIRVLCNANTSEGFKPSIDVSMPEIYLPDGTMDGLIGGPPPSERSVLVFYAGGIHGYIRQMLMDQWKNKDPDVQIHEYLPKDMSYYGMFRKSKYCICASGWEVASPRMVEAFTWDVSRCSLRTIMLNLLTMSWIGVPSQLMFR